MKRAHFQVSVWRAVLEKYHSELVPIWYGWEKDEASKSLLPVTVLGGAVLALLDVIKMIRCGCASDQP